jgi:hypothetical protein
MALTKKIVQTKRYKTADSYNNDVIYQGSAFDSVDVSSNDYVDGDGFGVYVGTGGDLAIKGVNGGEVTLTNIPDGAWLPIRISTIFNSGTTASDIVAYR